MPRQIPYAALVCIGNFCLGNFVSKISQQHKFKVRKINHAKSHVREWYMDQTMWPIYYILVALRNILFPDPHLLFVRVSNI